MPLEYCSAFLFASPVRPTNSISSGMRSWPNPSVSAAIFILTSPEWALIRPGSSMIAPTLLVIRFSPEGTLMPNTSMCPLSGRVSPRRARKVVVFPAPFGPRKPVTAPEGIWKSRPSSA